jgi:glycosyltransferase involved in cell wall biosynthesis
VVLTDSLGDTSACLEAMSQLALAEAILCYPEHAWCRDVRMPAAIRGKIAVFAPMTERALLWIERDTLTMCLAMAESMGVEVGSIGTAAMFAQQLALSGVGQEYTCETILSTVPGGPVQGTAIADRGAARHFVRASSPPTGSVDRADTESSSGSTAPVRSVDSVLFVCGTSAHSGAEEVMLRLAAGLFRLGVRVTLTIPMHGVVSDRFEALGGRVVCDDVARLDPIPDNVEYFRRFLRDEQPAVVHFTAPVGLPAVTATHLEDVPSVYHVHWLTIQQIAYEAMWCRKLIACSNTVRDALIAHGYQHDRIAVVPNSVEVPQLRTVDSLDSTEPIDILSVARFSSEKRHDVLIRAIAAVVAADGPITATLVGEDSCSRSTRVAVSQQVSKLGLDEMIKCVPFQVDVSKFYRRARCLVLTSECEAAPLVVLEAMAAGVPVVAAKIAAVAEMCDESHAAMLFEPGDAADCARCIRAVLLDHSLARQMIRRGHQWLARAHGEAVVMSRFLSVVNSVACRR